MDVFSRLLVITEGEHLCDTGGDCVRRDGGTKDSFSCTLKCHDANGELYYVKFTREQVTIPAP